MEYGRSSGICIAALVLSIVGLVLSYWAAFNL